MIKSKSSPPTVAILSPMKQPDVLLFLFFFSQHTEWILKGRTMNITNPDVPMSSLSPSIHSILAFELGKHEEAYEFASYAKETVRICTDGPEISLNILEEDCEAGPEETTTLKLPVERKA